MALRSRAALPYALTVLACCALSGCASKIKLAVAGSLMQDVAAATAQHRDLELAVQAAPAYLLILDGLLQDNPNNARVLEAATQAYTAYGSMIELDAPERARSAYRRAKEYGCRGLALKRGVAPLLDAPYAQFEQIAGRLRRHDLPMVFWAASAWGSWIAANTDSIGALAELPKVILLMHWALETDETYQFGAPHLFLGVYKAALPPALGGRPEEARAHFERAIELSAGRSLVPQVLMAKYYARQVYDRDLYVELLQQALELPVDAQPELTLQNVAAQRQARRLLEEVDEYF